MPKDSAARPRPQTRPSGPQQPKPRSDAYVGLLALSLAAQIAGALFLYLDYSQYDSNKDPLAIAKDLKNREYIDAYSMARLQT